LTVAASVEVWLEGQARSRGWAVPYPEPSGLFDADDRENKEWLRRWLPNGGASEGASEPADVAEHGGTTRMVIPIAAAQEAAAQESEPVRIIRATPPSSDCWSDVRDLLAERNRRMQGSMIASELARVGLAWSSRSLETTLAEARKSGLLDHVRGEGYMLTDRGRGLSLNEVRRIWGLRVTEEVER
jgi:hypothetical protein